MGQIPEMMRAVIAEGSGGPEVLKVVQRPVPKPKEGEILVRVKAAGVNRPDVIQRQGGYPPPPGAPDILGLEIAGEVAATGPNAARFSVGEPVMALVPGGGYADYAVVHESNVLPIPPGLSFEEAGAIPETFFTVWTNVFDRGRLRSGETLLVHGGTSGIGTTAIQLAKAFGATVIATAGSRDKCDACLRLGADVAINYRNQDFVTAAKEATGGRGVDVILDMVGGDYISRNYEAAAQDGRIVQIAFLQGPKAEVDFRRLMVKRLTHTGSTLRPRSPAEKADIAEALEEKVWPLLAQGRCRPVMDSTFAFEDVAKAHGRMDGGEHIGKIVLTL
ncbi:NAD(P)H-quinone oxidoreductase [Microvirga lotononidis]|uniref:Putative NAD(P)H quinone oxidoreductase, PIG3 family n=1 Tax=Microvirga lotononidis TaxID=864069 RepID=I4YTR8_9HYPH|nr:NAD(P)H-quinone oxidoreductase [Microvirga lotononidis]EIM27360.1 putative NAD(P)H quinone oxidoreductase, PIG3 family [Microvirga lotononidis]WQO28472.1 NAD(P)H-quinone oxidoreductase [Microvirga lotononidis]